MLAAGAVLNGLLGSISPLKWEAGRQVATCRGDMVVMSLGAGTQSHRLELAQT